MYPIEFTYNEPCGGDPDPCETHFLYYVTAYNPSGNSIDYYSWITLPIVPFDDPTEVEISNKEFQFSSLECYPNPFDENTKIKFNLSENAMVKIDIYNSESKRVINLIDKLLIKGDNYIDFHPTNLPTGNYFLGISAVTKTGFAYFETKKIAYLK